MEEVHWALDARDKFRAAHPEEDIEPLPQIMTVLYPNPGFPLNLSNARKKLKEAQCKARQQPQPQIDAPGLQNTGPEQSEEPKQQGGQHRTTKLKHADSNDIRTASVAQQADFLQQEGEAGGTINTWELDPLRDGLRRLLQLTQTSPSCGRSADERVALSASNLSALAGSCLHRPSNVLSGAGEPARGHGTEGLHTAISAPKPTASSDSSTRAPLELLPAANSSPLPAATKPPETRVLGLHGMGGIGKSVLARTLYDNAVGRKVLSKSFSVSGSKLASFVPCVCL